MIDRREFLAGGVGGALSVITAHPFDTVKVRLQTTTQYSGVFNCMKTMVAKEGAKSLFKGMLFPLGSVALVNAVAFSAYNAGVRQVAVNSADPSIGEMWVGGVAAGCAVSCLSPVELIKIQCQRVQGKHMVSPFQMTKEIFTRSGVPGLFRGFFTQLSRDSVGYSCFYLPYTVFGIYLLDKGFEDPIRICIAGAFAGLLSWGVTNPMDVIKTRYQCDLDAKSGRSVLRELMKTEGPVGFSRGIVANSLRGIPQCGALFFGYEYTLKYI